MNHAFVHRERGSLPAVRIFDGEAERSAFWRINGYRTRLVIWSAEEWAGLEERPADAQFHPIGVWCAIRID